ncbi:MAG: hypothetical protein ACE5HI_10775 [bacterium]
MANYNSEHISPDFFSAFFMFPFGFPFDKWENVSRIFDKVNGWEERQYDLSDGLEYNEYVYFYPYIRSIIFGTRETEKAYGVSFFRNLKIKNGKDGKSNAYYEVQNDNFAKKRVKLPLKNIFLHLFDTGVGILVFEIEHDSTKANERLALCDYLFFLSNGRRVYLPFVFPDAKKRKGDWFCSEAFDWEKDGRSNAIKELECASHVRLFVDDKLIVEHPFNEPFEIHTPKTQKADNERPTFWPPISQVITEFLDVPDQEFVYKNYDYWPIIDDRMLVHSFYSISGNRKDELMPWANKTFLNGLKGFLNEDVLKSKRNSAADVWYQMIFIDLKNPSCQNDQMLKRIINESSYNRWSNSGTFFGFSRFSSVTISNYNVVRYVYNHFQSMYYQIAILLLFYRGALLTFSHRSEILAKTIHGRGRKGLGGNFLNHLQRLHEDFILFRNKYWFREVTAQDQGIEMFDVWSRKLRNKELLEDVQAEIKELYLYVESANEKNISKKINILTFIGALFLPIVIATSFFGMNFALIDEDVMTNFVIRIVSRAFGLNLGPVWGEVTTFIAITVIVSILLVTAYFVLRKPWKT